MTKWLGGHASRLASSAITRTARAAKTNAEASVSVRMVPGLWNTHTHCVSVISAVPLPWLVRLVNEYAPQPREAAGEDHDPHPELMTDPRAPRISRVAQPDLISVAHRLWLFFAAVSESERAALFNDMLDDAELSPKVNERAELFWMTSRTDSGALLLAGCAAALL